MIELLPMLATVAKCVAAAATLAVVYLVARERR